MSDGWTTMAVTEVRPGDLVRMPNGQEVLVSRVEAKFFGTDTMVAFVEDTPERWFKQPARTGDSVEVRRSA
jgi:hypothetical protein